MSVSGQAGPPHPGGSRQARGDQGPLPRVARALVPLALLMTGIFAAPAPGQEMRFPKPEFQTGYDFPRTTVPPPTSEWQQWIDVGVLFAALSVASWLAVRKRSRKGIFCLMLFSLFYFGFYKQGCICPIGSIQNVAMALFTSNYAIPAAVLVFFLLPLIFALFFGRVFCSSVCALGAIQDVVLLFPVKVPKRVGLLLGMFPYAYLGTGHPAGSHGHGLHHLPLRPVHRLLPPQRKCPVPDPGRGIPPRRACSSAGRTAGISAPTGFSSAGCRASRSGTSRSPRRPASSAACARIRVPSTTSTTRTKASIARNAPLG